jgi:hypothetical protein
MCTRWQRQKLQITDDDQRSSENSRPFTVDVLQYALDSTLNTRQDSGCLWRARGHVGTRAHSYWVIERRGRPPPPLISFFKEGRICNGQKKYEKMIRNLEIKLGIEFDEEVASACDMWHKINQGYVLGEVGSVRLWTSRFEMTMMQAVNMPWHGFPTSITQCTTTSHDF